MSHAFRESALAICPNPTTEWATASAQWSLVITVSIATTSLLRRQPEPLWLCSGRHCHQAGSLAAAVIDPVVQHSAATQRKDIGLLLNAS